MKLVPKLRFKGFNDEWVLNRLGSLIQIRSGFSPSSYKLGPSGKFPFLKVEELNNSTKYQSHSRFFTDERRDIVPRGSVIFPKRGAAILNNKVRISAVDVLLDSNLMAITPVDRFLDAEFLYYKIYLEKLYKIADTSTIPQINNKHIEPYKIPLPSLHEQQKIASFLSVLDEKIQQLTRKKELLEQYKKGSMQQLFSGKLRFKDENGKSYPKWEEKRLGDFVLSYKGGAPLSPKDFTNEPGCEVIPKKGITAGGRLIIDNETPTYCKPDFYSEYEKSVIDNSYIITTLRDLVPSGPSIGYMVQYNTINKYILAQGVYAFKIDESTLSKEWIIQFSNTATYRKIMQTIMVGSTQVHIRNEEFFKLELNLPSISEQQKIACFLTALDAKIESVAVQIAHTQTFKKGLLQQMFV